MDNTAFKEESDSIKNYYSISDTSSESGVYSKGNDTLVANLSSPTCVIGDKTKTEPPVRTKYFYWKNFVGVSVSILCLLTAYNCLFYIQSSLHSKGGLGSLALAVDYGAQVVACLFVPALLMKKIGYKWTLTVAMVAVGTYIGANMHATFGTLMPTSIFMGIGFASMWATMNCLVCDLAKGYATLTDTDPAIVFPRFLGVFYTVVETGKIWGNLISSLALQPEGDGGIPDDQLAICGARYCNQKLGGGKSLLELDNYTNRSQWSNATATNPEVHHYGGATEAQVVILCSSALGICGFGILVVLFLIDSRKSSNDTSRLLSHILSTIKMLANTDLQLLIVITISAGLVQSFYASDFTKSFLTCSLGIHEVGFVSTCYGVVVVLGSLFTGCVAQFVGRQILLLLAATLNITDLLVMLFWVPEPNELAVFYVIAAIWAISTAIWLTTLTGLYGEVFATQHEEAFSNHRLCECIGFVIGFVWSPLMCMKHKIYGTIAFIAVGVVGYVALEIKLRRKNSNKPSDSK